MTKSEWRGPNQVRSPNDESELARGAFRTSGFVIVSDFVIRVSSFCLQQMPHFHALGLQVFRVMRVRFAPDRNLFDHLDSVAFQADDLLWIVR